MTPAISSKLLNGWFCDTKIKRTAGSLFGSLFGLPYIYRDNDLFPTNMRMYIARN